MRRGKLGWRAAARRYNSLTRDLAQRAAESVKRDREANALTVCPDGFACLDPRHVEARAAFMHGADWRTVFAIVYP